MGIVRTVTGDIDSSALGITSMHDHTLCDLRDLNVYFKGLFGSIPAEMIKFKLDNFSFLKTGMVLLSDEHSCNDDTEYLIGELKAFKKVGGATVCDSSPTGVRGNISDIREISKTSGVNIVCASGLFAKMQMSQALKDVIAGGEASIVKYLYKEINEGIDGTEIKPGFLKCALYGLTENGRPSQEALDVINACGTISNATNMSIQIHTESTLNPEDVLETLHHLIDERNVSPDKIVVLHTDQFLTRPNILNDYVMDINASKEISSEFHEKILETGVNISLDTWGSPIQNTAHYYPDDFDRMKVLVDLIKKGYDDKIVLGHDNVGKLYGTQYGNYGYTRISTFIPTMLKQLGFEDHVAMKLLKDNPARILSL